MGESLDRLASSLGVPAAVLRVWPELVGDAFASHAQPRWFREQTLVVEVDDPAWATQVRWLESELLGKLEGLLGHGRVLRIEVRVARR